MKTRIFPLVAALSLLTASSNLHAQGTAFTYQGQIENNGSPASGAYNLTFTLFNTTNTSATAIAGPVTRNGVNVTNGLFAVVIDFGQGVFTGQTNWLEIGVEANGASNFTVLTPRQQLTPAPYAIFANTASNLSGMLPATQLSGTVGDSQLADSSITVTAGTGLSGGGTVALGGSITLNATGTGSGVVSVTGNSDITATTVSGAVTLGDTATSADTPSLIVKRDATGSFSADNLTLDGALTLPSTSVNPDIIYSGSDLLLFGDIFHNFFAGQTAGNATTGGMGGSNNTAIGFGALGANTTGYDNTAIGWKALTNNTTGLFNTADGYVALALNTTGRNNTAIGYGAINSCTTGYFNTAVGVLALYQTTTGSNNIALGFEAGSQLTGNANADIDIGNSGTAGDVGIIRIGVDAVQTKCYLAGTVYANGVALTSDRNAKENFKPVDYQAVLAKVASLPVSEWNYKTDSKGVEHIGPMAQDFQAAFQLSDDDKHISVVDEGGVALAAIQGLNQKLEAETKAKDVEIETLKQSVAELKKMVQTLAENK